MKLFKLVFLLGLVAVISLPGNASADFVQSWVENGYYGSPSVPQTWDRVEAFLISPGNWTGTGLGFSEAGWTSTLVNPRYVVASGPSYNSSVMGNFSFTTSATDPSGPFVWDWFLWNGSSIVGVQQSSWSPSGGWNFVEITSNIPFENRLPRSHPRLFAVVGQRPFRACGPRLEEKEELISSEPELNSPTTRGISYGRVILALPFILCSYDRISKPRPTFLHFPNPNPFSPKVWTAIYSNLRLTDHTNYTYHYI